MTSELAMKFEQFHSDNPHIYTTLVHFAREWMAQTHRNKLGIAMLVERTRWDLTIRTKSDDDYKIANAHRAFYARLIMFQEPDLRGLFDMSTSAADDWIGRKIAEADRRNGQPG